MIDISIIIPTRNRANLLRITLQSILTQSLNQSAFEVIVVNNGSSDNTEQVSIEYKERFLNFMYILEGQPGLHNGRHTGVKNAQSNLLVFIDDDIEASPNWLEGILEAFKKDENIAMVGGKNLPKWETPPPQWLWEMWFIPKKEGKWLGQLSILDFGEDEKYFSPSFIWGCNFAIKKSILQEVNGFHPDGMPQELIQFRGDGESAVSDAVEKAGYLAYYSPKASIYHFVPSSRMTIDYFKRRQFNQGISDSYSIIRRFKGIPPPPKKTLRHQLKKIRDHLTRKEIRTLLNNSQLEQEMDRSYKRGFNFHQEAVKKDPRLLAWVLKDNYW